MAGRRRKAQVRYIYIKLLVNNASQKKGHPGRWVQRDRTRELDKAQGRQEGASVILQVKVVAVSTTGMQKRNMWTRGKRRTVKYQHTRPTKWRKT